MSFTPTVLHDSSALPGVRFTVHRMGFGRRVDLDLKTLKLRQRLRELEIENPPDTPAEKELHEQILIARQKAIAVPEEQQSEVVEKDLLPLLAELRNVQAAVDPETKKLRAVLNEEYSQIEAQIRAVWVREGLISMEGGEVEGMTPGQLLEYGPAALAEEIYAALAGDGKLSGAESKNSFSPTTSGAPVGGETTPSSASSAAPPAVAIT